jgi:hypothetical protein
MNDFFYGKERVNDLMKEGMTSQAHYRSGSQKRGLLHRLPKLILLLFVLLGFLGLLFR